ncbi:major facilitator superfamily domain-containing protein [Xylaria cf. heliscus]|nr:major facilitator superfamily domain-containing protein [Xylaria cf. heliscus]
MEQDPVLFEQETTALLHGTEAENTQYSSPKDTKITAQHDFNPQYVLPIALLSALAMASTAATSYFAFATLLCKDPRHCKGDETVKYAGFVAVAACTANILGMSSLGHLQKLLTMNRRLGLLLWMVCRSMSAIVLLVGVSVGSIYFAFSARIFEGLASDNLLHFNLNAIYAQSTSKDRASSLISYSLALYMIGISVSPFVAGLFDNFTTSFVMALGLFVVAIVYIQLCLPASTSNNVQATAVSQQEGARAVESQQRNGVLSTLTSLSMTVFSPLEPLRKRPIYLFIGLSLFCYNVVQSYIFDALLVHTSIRFGFSAKENGLIITTVHSIGALYILTTIYLIPKTARYFHTRTCFQILQSWLQGRNKYSMMAQLSLIVHVLSLTALGFANEARQIYPITTLLAIGLPIPAFIKAYFLSLFESDQRPVALAVLAMMETVGSVIGPLLLGGLQSYFSSSGRVFFAAAGLGGASLILLVIGASIIGANSSTVGQV